MLFYNIDNPKIWAKNNFNLMENLKMISCKTKTMRLISGIKFYAKYLLELENEWKNLHFINDDEIKDKKWSELRNSEKTFVTVRKDFVKIAILLHWSKEETLSYMQTFYEREALHFGYHFWANLFDTVLEEYKVYTLTNDELWGWMEFDLDAQLNRRSNPKENLENYFQSITAETQKSSDLDLFLKANEIKKADMKKKVQKENFHSFS